MKSAFDKIAAGLEDAIAFVEGDDTRGRTRVADGSAALSCCRDAHDREDHR